HRRRLTQGHCGPPDVPGSNPGICLALTQGRPLVRSHWAAGFGGGQSARRIGGLAKGDAKPCRSAPGQRQPFAARAPPNLLSARSGHNSPATPTINVLVSPPNPLRGGNDKAFQPRTG